MAERDLTINMRMRKDQAEATSRQFYAAEMARLEKYCADMIAGTREAEQVKRAEADKTSKVYRDAQGRMRDEHGKFVAQGVQGFGGLGAATALWTVGLQQALNIARLMGETVNREGERSRELAAKFVGQRESLGELAGLMGRKADTQFTRDIARFGAATGFTPDESRNFLSRLYDAGAQYKGTDLSLGQHMAGSEFDQYSRQLGRLALTMDLDPGHVATMGGAMLGTTDFNKFGPLAAENALGRVHRAMKIMGAGQGETSEMVKQYKLLSSAAFSEKELVGLFHDTDDVAIAASLMAQSEPGEAANLAAAGGRALRKPTAKAAAFRKRMGIDLSTPYLEAMMKMGLPARPGELSPIEREARAMGPGATTEDVFKATGFSIREARGLAVGTQHAGVIAQRRDVASKFPGFTPTLDFIDEEMAGERMMMRRRQAETAEAETGRGAENARLSILREEARGNLIREKKDVPGLLGAAGNALPFSLAGDRAQLAIDVEAQEILRRRGGDTGTYSDMLNVSPVAREADLRGQMERLQARGVNPLTGAPIDPANAEMLKIEQERERREGNKPGPVLNGRPSGPAGYFNAVPR